MFGHASMGEYHLSPARSGSRKLKSGHGENTIGKLLTPPRLHEPLARDEIDIDPRHQSAQCGKGAAHFTADRGLAPRELRVLLGVGQ